MDSHPRGLCNGKPNRINKASALVHFFCSSFSLYKWGVRDHCVTGKKCPIHHCCAQTGWAFQQSSLSLLNSSSHHVSLAWCPLYGHSPGEVPICWVPSHLHTEKVGLLSQWFTWPSLQQEDPHWLPRAFFCHLATSVPWVPAEGEQACKIEWLQECLQPLEEGLADPTSLSRPFWPCIWQVLGTASSCTHTIVCGGVHLVQLHALSCKCVLPTSGFLHQGTQNGSTQRDDQGLTQLSPLLILGSTLDALFFAWHLCYGTCAARGKSPIPVSGLCSSPGAPCVIHLRITSFRGSRQLLCLSSQFSGHTLSPVLPIWRSFHSAK